MVDHLRNVTLLGFKIKCLTRVLALALGNLVESLVPLEPKGFMRNTCMDSHLITIQVVWRGIYQGLLLSIDFRKAFDGTDHDLTSVFSIELEQPGAWV